MKNDTPYSHKWDRFESAMNSFLKVNYPGLNVPHPNKVSRIQ